MIIGLPIFVHFVWFACDFYQCSEVLAIRHLLKFPIATLKTMFPFPSLNSVRLMNVFFYLLTTDRFV